MCDILLVLKNIASRMSRRILFPLWHIVSTIFHPTFNVIVRIVMKEINARNGYCDDTHWHLVITAKTQEKKLSMFNGIYVYKIR